ncbi:MAG TPA: class I SAM-dependent methyltransferase [Nitrospirae bacterium]|nr:Mg-protoporphyrin IX methyl transferase [bacterium BMS3Abin06]HDH11878.1 class I SAM-dependent methyltransferase [Nitrospirota bacterium]HDZ02780.1 class I SAM-dependent methyltransferase [Nitrospirota bacterium]
MKHYWDREIEKFDKIYENEKNILERFIDIFRKDVIFERAEIVFRFAGKLDSNSTVVDLGCGTGRQAIKLARMGFKVYGFDISERAIELARSQIKDEKINLDFENCDVVKKEYPECELIVGLGLMDYLTTDEILLILRQIKQLNCRFIFSFPYRCIKSYIRFLYRYLTGTKIYFHSPEEISELFRSVGIDNVKMISENLSASVVAHNFDEKPV